MKRLFAPALLAVALAAPASAETRDLSGFTSVNAADRMIVTVSIGERYAVEVTGSDAGRVRTRLDGDTLRIQDEDRPWFGTSPRLDAQVRITLPTLEGISAARGAEVTAALTGGCRDLSVAAAMGGSARVTGAQCADVDASASMGGEVRLDGVCRDLDASASMGGYVRADDLHCTRVDASASMGGAVQAYATESYDASATMGGDINVAGGAQGADTSTIMGGSIRSNNR